MDSVSGMRVFARVVEAGSFSAAGRQIGAAPSSVSRRIGDLEEELGARLFNRTTRKLSLTEAGRIYLDRVARILLEIDEAKLAVSQVGGAPSGILRVTVPGAIGRQLVAGALPAFMDRYPAVRVVLSMTDRMVDLVDAGFDLGIRVGRQRGSSLIARKIGTSRRFVCGSPGYLERAGEPATPAELADHDCLTFREHPGSNVWRFRGLEGDSDVRVSGSLFANSVDALSAAAVAGLGLILIPDWNIGTELGHGTLRTVLRDYQVIPDASPIYAVYPHQRHLPPKVRAFIDFLADRFSTDGDAQPDVGET